MTSTPSERWLIKPAAPALTDGRGYLVPEQLPGTVPSSVRDSVVRDGEGALHVIWAQSAGGRIWGSGGPYDVLLPGRLNGGAGPDFLGSVIRFPDGTVRRGDVEIHSRAYGWSAHRHQVDPRFAAVLAHVVGAGPLTPVQSVRGPVPTLLLSRRGAPDRRPCEEGGLALAAAFPAIVDDFIRQLARQRWNLRLAAWQGLDTWGQLRSLAGRLGPGDGAVRLHDQWRSGLFECAGLPHFLELMGCGAVSEPVSRSARQAQRRVRLLSAVAYVAMREPEHLLVHGWETMKQLLVRLRAASYPLPSGQFAIEVAGNWLIPWRAATARGPGFRQWYGLPIGWSYGRVKRLARKLGLPAPASFGEQQGFLEWEQSLCHNSLCAACPVTG